MVGEQIQADCIPGSGFMPREGARRYRVAAPYRQEGMVMDVKVIHVIAPYQGDSPLFQRQELFLKSVDCADRENVSLLALADNQWQRAGWETRPLIRDARIVGDETRKPFIRNCGNN